MWRIAGWRRGALRYRIDTALPIEHRYLICSVAKCMSGDGCNIGHSRLFRFSSLVNFVDSDSPRLRMRQSSCEGSEIEIWKSEFQGIRRQVQPAGFGRRCFCSLSKSFLTGDVHLQERRLRPGSCPTLGQPWIQAGPYRRWPSILTKVVCKDCRSDIGSVGPLCREPSTCSYVAKRKFLAVPIEIPKLQKFGLAGRFSGTLQRKPQTSIVLRNS